MEIIELLLLPPFCVCRGEHNTTTKQQRQFRHRPKNMTENNQESVTQLADSQPQIDNPLRILLPLGTNAPARVQGACRDDYIRTNAFSPAAYTTTLNISPDDVSIGPNNRIPSLNSTSISGSIDSQAKIKTAISHYTVLAFSCHRAGKKEVEASAYISLAVIYDNLSNYKPVR
jgi:hypothetical protein